MVEKTKKFIGFGLLIGVVCAAMVAGINKVNAAAWSWTASAPIIDSKDNADPNSTWANSFCELPATDNMVVTIGRQDYQTDCAIGNTAQFRLYTYYDSSTNHSLAIRFTGDSHVTRILGIGCPGDCTYLPSTDEYVMVDAPAYSTGPVHIYKNFVKNLKLRMSTQLANNYYEFNQQTPDTVAGGMLPYGGYVKHVKRSDNDKWLLLESSAGLLRYDIQSGKTIRFSDWRLNYHGGFVAYAPNLTITNDGLHVAVLGRQAPQEIFDISSSCGDEMPDNPAPEIINSTQQNICPYLSLHNNDNEAANSYIPYFDAAYAPQFSEDGGELNFYVTSTDTSIPPRFIRMHAAGYTVRRLDYLALGDSYSSGEGDTEKDSSGNKYYRVNTDTATERCHLSTRSYPYKLATSMHLTINNQWNSVTCSGATAWDVKEQGSPAYLGQGDRLKGLNYESLKEKALNEFIPGREKQIEFVKKYRPKVITLTMGGNDVGFGDKIQGCTLRPDTCDIAKDRKSSLKSEILGQYNNLKSLYEELYRASGAQAKIFVIGYPRFINGDNVALCEVNIGMLNNDERSMIQNSVSLLNNVIKQAAKAAGVKYVDIESSLVGHRLCDVDKKYVTGIADPLNLGNNRQESFHPNASGHQAIASAILNNLGLGSVGLADYDICPLTNSNSCPDSAATKDSIEIPAYFQGVESTNTEQKKMSAFDQTVNETMDVVSGSFTFAQNTFVTVIVHSDPISLGQYAVNEDGSLSASIVLPATVSAGMHTLIVSGTTYSGDPIEYEQAILVKGADPKDVDGDGIVDTQDKCLFIPASNKDVDKDGIDDACDPEIGDPPVTPTLSPSPTPTASPTPAPKPSNPVSVVSILTGIVKAITKVLGTLISLLQKILIR